MLTSERIDKIFQGYPLNPGEGRAIEDSLHSKGLLGAEPIESWRGAVETYRATTSIISPDAVKALMDMGGAEAAGAMKSDIGSLRRYHPGVSNAGLAKEARKQSTGTWAERIRQPRAYRNHRDALESLKVALGNPTKQDLNDRLSGEQSFMLTSALKGKLTRLSDANRETLHAFINGSTKMSGESPPRAPGGY